MTLEEVKKIKTSEMLDYPRAELKSCAEIKMNLEKLDREFNASTDLSDIEFYVGLQKKMNGYLLSFTPHYSKLKIKKESIDRRRKEWKSRITRAIVRESNTPNAEGDTKKLSINQAEKIVDADPRYVYILKLVDTSTAFVSEVESLHWHFNETLKMIHQSVGIARGERSRPETSTGEE